MGVEVKTVEVLAKLYNNRKQHIAIFTEAQANYLATVKAGLEEALAKVESGKYKVTDYISVSFNPPKDYTEVYDQAIAMLELETREIIPLDQEQFTCLVMDKWHWKNDFLTSNAGYSNAAQLAVGRSRYHLTHLIQVLQYDDLAESRAFFVIPSKR